MGCESGHYLEEISQTHEAVLTTTLNIRLFNYCHIEPNKKKFRKKMYEVKVQRKLGKHLSRKHTSVVFNMEV